MEKKMLECLQVWMDAVKNDREMGYDSQDDMAIFNAQRMLVEHVTGKKVIVKKYEVMFA